MPRPPRPRRILRAATALAVVNLGVGGAALVVAGAGEAPEPAASPEPVAPAVLLVAEVPVAPPALHAAVHPLLATTSTSAPPAAVAPAARSAAAQPARRASGPPPSGAGATRRVVSTGYCLEGTTSSGVDVGPGMVAMNGVAMGSRWRVHDGPHRGRTLEVTDRIGHGTEFDIWFDDCAAAVEYGRRTITVERVG